MSETLEPALPDHLDEQAERLMRRLCDLEFKVDHNDAVSAIVAKAMAEGAIARSDADLALGVTGFAGPAGGGCEEGLVHFALARRGGETVHREEHFGALGRGEVRVKSLGVLLEMLEQALEQA